MKMIFNIIQWIFAGVLAIFALVNGLHFSSLFLVLAAILLMPISAIRNFLKNKLKIKSWLVISLALVLLFVGILASPTSEPTEIINNSSDNSSFVEDISSIDDVITGIDENSSAISSENNKNSIAQTTSSENTLVAVGNGTAIAVKPDAIPAYSGNAYVAINNNVPSFSLDELTTVAYEQYSNLDSLGRCGVALASCGKEIMPKDNEERGSISSIKPTGWSQAKYDCVSGGWLYNRCHLIGWQLSAENANNKNLITGTRYMNTEGMLPFENMVADYINETENHVAYRVTPIYEGKNLLASGVQIEAYSIEDNGEGICFNVYVYNVQPDITINYANGESSLNSTENSKTESQTAEVIPPVNIQPETQVEPETQPEPQPDSEEITTQTPVETEELVWVTKTGKRYHSISNCGNTKSASQVSKSTAESRGLTACDNCW